jgi:hypothetical protein
VPIRLHKICVLGNSLLYLYLFNLFENLSYSTYYNFTDLHLLLLGQQTDHVASCLSASVAETLRLWLVL